MYKTKKFLDTVTIVHTHVLIFSNTGLYMI